MHRPRPGCNPTWNSSVCSGQTSERLLKPGSCASASARMQPDLEFVFTPDRWKLKQRERDLHTCDLCLHYDYNIFLRESFYSEEVFSLNISRYLFIGPPYIGCDFYISQIHLTKVYVPKHRMFERNRETSRYANCKVRKSITYEWAGFARHGCICGSQCVNLSYKP